ncbi:MAG: class I SAM-dependent RNA methyltransferase [Actinobacteria bacterium]|nr:class I SAM-dependent RNA methyltransferase [Actinomycetota bacterium]
MNVGDRITVTVGGIAHGGHCVARHDGRVIFLRYAIPGEEVIAEITDVTSKFARGLAIEILKASPDRVSAPCNLARPGGCGGCDFQHIEISAQRKLKSQIVKEQFSRVAKMEVDVEVIGVDPANGLGWRTRMDFTVNPERKVALYGARSHNLIPISKCLIADERMDLDSINQTKLPVGAKVEVAISQTGKQFVAIEGRENFDLIDEQVLNKNFSISPTSFWQSHIQAPEVLTNSVLGYLGVRAGDHVFDLYGGVGLFTAALATQVTDTGRVTLIELDAGAIIDAKRIFAEDQIVEIVEGKVERSLSKFKRADLILLDPPRSGAGKDVVNAMAKLEPRAIVYVSCDPASLARDATYLVELGYKLDGIQSFDLFPMTQHIECVARFLKIA